MAKRISALQPSGEILLLEVTPETTGKELKQQIKDKQRWDELTHKTTGVEIIVGHNHLLADDVEVLDAGIAEYTVVTVVFKPNKVICSNKDTIASLGRNVDLELPLVVEVPDNETDIPHDAFMECKTLAKLTIPNTVTHIGESAFHSCTSWSDLTIPNSVTHIGEHAFAGCISLANLTVPDSVTHIGNSVFRNCSSLASLTIPESVTHIGESAFYSCTSLSNLTIPNSVTHIGEHAFADCISLANLTIPDSVTYIGESAFF